jgi:hypothetical protein
MTASLPIARMAQRYGVALTCNDSDSGRPADTSTMMALSPYASATFVLISPPPRTSEVDALLAALDSIRVVVAAAGAMRSAERNSASMLILDVYTVLK